MAMKSVFTYRNLSSQEKRQAETYLSEKLKKIEMRLPPGEALLRVRVERFAKKSAYKVELELSAPRARYFSSEDDHTIPEAVDFSLNKLMKQVKRSSGLRRPSHHKYPRAHAMKARWDAFEEMREPEESAESEREEFFENVRVLAEPLLRTIQHEVRVWGFEGEDDVAPEAMVDEAILAIWDGRKRKPPQLTFRQWLYQTAFKIVGECARKLRKEDEGCMSLDQILPEESESFQVSNLGDEVKDFWQPDELTTIADTIGERKKGDGLTPRQKAQYHRVLTTLAGLNAQARQAFLLRYKEGFEAYEIAMIQRRKPAVVEKDLAEALSFLRTHLI